MITYLRIKRDGTTNLETYSEKCLPDNIKTRQGAIFYWNVCQRSSYGNLIQCYYTIFNCCERCIEQLTKDHKTSPTIHKLNCNKCKIKFGCISHNLRYYF